MKRPVFPHNFQILPGYRLIIAKPNSDGGEFDEGEIAFGVLFVAGGEGPEVFDLVEETLDLVPVAAEECAEGENVLAVRHRLDAGPCAPGFQVGAHGI